MQNAKLLFLNLGFARQYHQMVGDEGIEPSTSSLSEMRSTTELVAQNFHYYLKF